VGNKTDLEKDRKVSPEEGEKFARDFVADYHETSVKFNAGVDDTFTTIAKKIINKIR
jgi:GTPase SAR1 family protein